MEESNMDVESNSRDGVNEDEKMPPPDTRQEEQVSSHEKEKDESTNNDKDDDDQKPPASSKRQVSGDAAAAEKQQRKERRRQRKKRKRDEYRRKKLFQDCLSVEIPIDVTADLGVALRHTRAKRLKALQQICPALLKNPDGEGGAGDSSSTALVARGGGGSKEEGEDVMEDGEEGAVAAAPDAANNKKRKRHVGAPDRNNYSTVLDYLEAKYAKGVMIDGPQGGVASGPGEAAEGDEDEDGRGSVYSKNSFLDDSDLQRDVAEQVLAHTTKTKVELMGKKGSGAGENFDDNEFFVNVGALEVEETEQTKAHYDPLQDVNDEKPRKPKKPRTQNSSNANSSSKPAAAASNADNKKKPAPKKAPPKKAPLTATSDTASKSSKGSASAPAGGGSKKKVPNGKAKTAAASVKKDASSAGSASDSASPPPSKKKKSSEPTLLEMMQAEALKQKVEKLQQVEDEKKEAMEKAYAQVVHMIGEMTDEDLPKKAKSSSEQQPKVRKVAVTCPSDKGPGDTVLFQNPHNPGQRLKVKIPKTIQPGGTFKVTVPVKPPPDEEEEGDGTDHNKWSREFYEALSDYAYCFDEWMDKVTERHNTADKNANFPGHHEKRKKFDKLVDEFPNATLKTPIDKAYLQKILRRARQNKHKRDKTARRLEERAKELSAIASSSSDAGTTPAKQQQPSSSKPSSAGSGGESSSKKEAASPQRPAAAPTGKQLRIPKAAPPRQRRLLVQLPALSNTFRQRPFVETDFS